MKGNSTPCAFVWHIRVSLVSSLSFWQRGCVFVFVSLAVRWCLCICLFLCLFLCIFLCICLCIVFVFVFLAVSCRSSRSILGASGDVSSLSPAPTLQLAGSLDKRKTFCFVWRELWCTFEREISPAAFPTDYPCPLEKKNKN